MKVFIIHYSLIIISLFPIQLEWSVDCFTRNDEKVCLSNE
jgi:hypothetical protein